MERRLDSSNRARATLDCRLNVPYGASEDQKLDVFPAAGAGRPVLVYVHGGQWHYRSKDDVSFLAEAFVPAGVALVAPDYSLAPAVTLDEMVAQVVDAVAWTYENAESFGADPRRLHLAGHSAGSHLSAMALATISAGTQRLPSDIIRTTCLTSGLYDLEPVRHTSMNQWLSLDARAAARLSPRLHVPAAAGMLTLAVGGAETSGFRRQTSDFVDAWRAAGHPVNQVDLPNLHHYSMTLELGDPESPLFAAALSAILSSHLPEESAD
jgi:arylformamidase